MKKIFFALASLLLFATSCSNIDDIGGTGKPEQPATVSVNLGLPQMQTRAYSDGTTAKKLEYAVYDITADGKKLLEPYTKQGADAEEIEISKPVSFQLVTGHTYGFVFWASSEDSPYEVTFTEDGATMTADYDGVTANNETLDAFYAYEVIEVNGDLQADVNLYRPFAQINVGTNDYEAAKSIGYAPTQSAVTVSEAYSAFDLISGEVTGDATEVSFGFGTIPGAVEEVAEEDFPVLGYDYLAMVYVLADKEQAVTDVTFEYSQGEGDAAKSRTVGSVPVQRNHRTNIFGQILTSNADLEVTIIPDYDDPQFDLKLAGVEFEPGTGELGKEGATFKISSSEGLKWLAAQVSNHGSHELVNSTTTVYGGKYIAFEGQTIELTEDINMAGINWTPIGYETKENGASNYAFAGTFDGKNYTISNLTVNTEGSNNAGLFGATNLATIKNVKLKNVNINSHYKTGAIVGDAWSTTIEDCTVEGGTITSTPWEKEQGKYDDANNVGGIVGYLEGYPYAAAVKNCTVDGLTITAFRKVGGIAGVAEYNKDNYGEPSATISGCTVKNTTIIADMTETRYDGFDKRVADIGKIVGLYKEGTTLQNNTDTENVTTKVIASTNLSNVASVLGKGGDAVLSDDIEATAAIGQGYGGYYGGVNVNGGTLDGNDKTLFVTNARTSGNSTWDAVVATNGGTIKNLTIKSDGSMAKGILAWSMTSDLYIDNVKVPSDAKLIYGINFDSSNGHNVYASNSTFCGWCSWGSYIPQTTFTDCSFGIGTYYGSGNLYNGLVKPYNNTLFENCDFDEDIYMDLSAVISGATIEFKNCKVNGVLLTKENRKMMKGYQKDGSLSDWENFENVESQIIFSK